MQGPIRTQPITKGTHNMKKIDLDTLFDMLRYRRPEGSRSQQKFCREFLQPVFGNPDRHGNYLVHIGDEPSVVFSAHHDTVHRQDGIQRIHCQAGVIAELHQEESESNCLGADDAAGIWLQLRMIESGVAGTYVVHAAEEIGGQGSEALVNDRPDWLDERRAVIAFDRRGEDSVITHQKHGRCCSNAFADRVISLLGPEPTEFRKDAYGSFTDSANYPDHLERTNLSCGYAREHTRKEALDLLHLTNLAERLIRADWSRLHTGDNATLRVA